jgi:8-oxo-dGTP pyrophosphatase MutT (NUDIX family)
MEFSSLDSCKLSLDTFSMALPYKIATLLYCFNEAGEVLLLERAQEPNRGLWSPCGGKLKMDLGESPYACACREAHEEIGLPLDAVGFASGRPDQRARLPGPDALADVPVRGEGEIKIAPAGPRGRPL